MILELKDSRYIDGQDSGWNTQEYISSCLQAIDKLKKSDIESFSLQNGRLKEIDKNIIWYSYDNPNKATFYTSHYIGYYSTAVANKNVNIEVKPRFGNGIFNHFLSHAYGIYIPKSDSISTSNTKSNNLWLITIMWKSLLEKAITKSQIPKEYKSYKKNSTKFKGKLQVSKHIKNNLIDKSKFYCKYRKLTMDTVINQTIRYTYRLLVRKQKGLNTILKDIAEYDNTLLSFGVKERDVSFIEIQNIRYSKLNIYYKKVMELSMIIIKSESSKNNNKSLNKEGFSYFIDIAELWENYLLKILQKNLPQYNIYSPNDRGGDYLIEDSFRQIRPDIIIEDDDEKIIAILDAKYKWYNKIGKYANFDNAVSREDLYQMTTYLYHYGNCKDKIIGLFVSPIGGEDEVKHLNEKENHKIGVINLNIQQFNEQEDNQFSLELINQEETNFINKIKKELSNDTI